MHRISFNDVMKNYQIGKILEENYNDSNKDPHNKSLKDDYYDSLKLLSSKERLDKAVEDSYAVGILPNLAKQTFQLIDNNNSVIKKNIISYSGVNSIGTVTAIAGGDYSKLESDSYGSVSGYKTNLSSVYLGSEYQMDKNYAIGGVLTMGKADSDFDSTSSSRHDYDYQLNAYLTYLGPKNIKFTFTLFGGVTYTELDRNLSIILVQEKFVDNLNNYYLGTTNILSKRYNFGQNYLEPKVEFNLTYMSQDGINESKDYGVKIDGIKSISIVPGIGVVLGRDMYTINHGQFNIETAATLYTELADPYKDDVSTFKLFGQSVKVDGYDNNKYYGNISLRGSYETESLLNIYAEVDYVVGDAYNEVKAKAGLVYRYGGL